MPFMDIVAFDYRGMGYDSPTVKYVREKLEEPWSFRDNPDGTFEIQVGSEIFHYDSKGYPIE